MTGVQTCALPILRQQVGLARPARVLLALCALQLITGLSNVVLGWPLLAAVLHTGGASALMLTLVWMLALGRVAPLRLPQTQPPSEFSRPVA